MECKCGNKDFYATQAVIGSISVIVDTTGAWIRNPTEDNRIEENGLDFSDPEGPFECTACKEIYSES